MGTSPAALARELRDELGLERAVETGTYKGNGARRLAGVFPEVVTIELSEELARIAASKLADTPAVRVENADSRQIIPTLLDPGRPTFWFLDGHWSAGATAGAGDECPVLDEVRLLAAGHPDDCIVIDDARLFMAAAAPPFDPAQWPSLTEVLDRLREVRPGAYLTVVGDQVVCTPQRASTIVDRHVREWWAPLIAPLDPRLSRRPGPRTLLRRLLRARR
jgi:hypothetical protein